MIDLLQIASESAHHVVEAGAHAVTTADPLDAMLPGFKLEVGKLISQILSIVIIFGMLRLLAWKPILKILDDRRNKIADGLQYAEEMKTKLAEAERKQSEILKEASLEAKSIQEQAQKSAREFVEKTQVEAQRKAEELVSQTRESLTLERKQMLAEVKAHASELIATTTAAVLRRELDAGEQARYTERAVKELSN
jgi:F-type H+-transporting ATPase subunit b